MASATAKRIGGGAAVVVVVVIAGVGLNWNRLTCWYAASQFRSAPTDEARTAHATKLLAFGEPGIGHLADTLRTGTPEQCRTVAAVVGQHLQHLPPDDPRFAAVCRPFLAACDTPHEPGVEAVFDLLPELLRCPDAAERCRGVVKAGLAATNTDVKARAVRLAGAPQFGLRADLVPLLNDPAADIRRAAMTAVGPLGVGDPVVETEDLFRWLNDPDDQVRLLCEAALSTRELEPEQIDAGRKLTHPEASERLTLLVDLQRGRSGAFRDPGPWLERLSRDTDPAVRAGAARVACESRLTFTPWLERMTGDPDPTVRQIVGYHRGRAEQLKQAGYDGR